ncbi:hypothetical protein Ocin01_15081 [Orchesella cincta]|uniref:Uncharacterized protein n=1 Tax=Orchesella cincta TaxID=48709 RepID=A0A1D2MF18_ORCCI|nr:hypothetical protein Ocin01_15081 [Orchesella cincta]
MRSIAILLVALVLVALVIVDINAEAGAEPSAGCPDKPTEPCWWNNWQFEGTQSVGASAIGLEDAIAAKPNGLLQFDITEHDNRKLISYVFVSKESTYKRFCAELCTSTDLCIC